MSLVARNFNNTLPTTSNGMLKRNINHGFFVNNEDKEQKINKNVLIKEENHDMRINLISLINTKCPANKGAVAMSPHPQLTAKFLMMKVNSFLVK